MKKWTLPSWTLASVLVFATMVGSTVGCHEHRQPRRAVLILLDAARPDRMSTYGHYRSTTPNIDGLAQGGQVFLKHYAQGTATRRSLPSLLFSRYFFKPIFPRSRDVPYSSPEDLFRTPDEGAISLPAALSRAGLRTAMISAHTWLKPDTLFAQEFDDVQDLTIGGGYDPQYFYPRAEKVVDAAIEWIASHREEEFFLYLHFMDTHFPHRFDDSARQYFSPERIKEVDLSRFDPMNRPFDWSKPLTGADREYLEALYDGSFSYVDHHLGRLFSHIWSLGLQKSTLIAITSDHGEFLLEVKGRFEHGLGWYERLGRIPLIVSYPPAAKKGRFSFFTENVDVMPYILGLLEVPLPRGRHVDGRNLQELVGGEAQPSIHAFMNEGVRGLRFKLIGKSLARSLESGDSLESDGALENAELYDLVVDVDEQRNLLQQRPKVAKQLLGVFQDHLAGPFRTYEQSLTLEMPSSPFAIGSRHFRSIPSVKEDSAVGWSFSNHWRNFFFLAESGAEPLSISFPVPSGEYRLSASVRGAASFLFGEERVSAEKAIITPDRPFNPVNRSQFGTVTLGTVRVEDALFRVEVTPDGRKGPLAVAHFGFEPLSEEPHALRDDPDRLEQLKALGYVE